MWAIRVWTLAVLSTIWHLIAQPCFVTSGLVKRKNQAGHFQLRTCFFCIPNVTLSMVFYLLEQNNAAWTVDNMCTMQDFSTASFACPGRARDIVEWWCVSDSRTYVIHQEKITPHRPLVLQYFLQIDKLARHNTLVFDRQLYNLGWSVLMSRCASLLLAKASWGIPTNVCLK